MQSTIQAQASPAWARTSEQLLGAAVMIAAVLQVIAGLLHPDDSPAGMAQSIWGPVHVTFFIAIFVQLIGIVRIYGLASRDIGWPGLIAFVLFAFGTAGFQGVMLLESGVVPVLARSEATRTLLDPTGPLMGGPLGSWFIVIALTFSAGAVLFGLLLLRCREFPRWAGPLLVAAPLFAFEPPIPLWLAKTGLVIFSAGVLGLGWGIWQRAGKT